MESAPAGSVALTGCPAWHVAVAAVAVATIAASIGWAVGGGVRAPTGTGLGPAPWAGGAAALLAAVTAIAAGTLWRCPTGRLAWSGDRWRFEPRPSGGSRRAAEPVEGTIAVAVDLGNVLLLVLHPAPHSPTAGRFARVMAPAFLRWLPVERSAAEGDWHGLRVALAAGRTR